MIPDRHIWESYVKVGHKVFRHFVFWEICKGCKCRVTKSKVVVRSQSLIARRARGSILRDLKVGSPEVRGLDT